MINQKYNTPILRFSEYLDEWAITNLIDLSSNGFSNGVFNDPNKVGKGYRIINVKDMYIDGSIDVEKLTLVDIDEKEFIKNKIEYGDILFTRSSLVKEGIAYSNVNLSYADDLTYDGHLIRMRPKKEKSVPSFLYYLLKTAKVRSSLVKKGKTTTMTTIGQDDIAVVEVNLPSLPEQQKIASFLTTVDDKLQALKKKKTLLEEYKKGVMQKIFSQEIRFRDDNGKEYPEWEEKTLGEVAKFSKGKGISKNDISDTGKTECIRYGELYTHYEETINVVKSRTNIEISKLVLSEANDVIIPASGETQIDIAKASCILRSGIALGGDLNIIKTKNNGIFLSYYLNNAKKQDIANLAQGISVVHLYSSQLSLLLLNIPCILEQIKIANFLTSIDDKINNCQTQIDTTEMWKKGLMQRMFC
jgi:type I restriction enzyme S subunit